MPSFEDKDLLKYDFSLKKLYLSKSIFKTVANSFIPSDGTNGVANTTKLARKSLNFPVFKFS